MKYAWIDGQRKAYPLPAMCATLAVSLSGYQAWKRGGTPNRKRLTDTQLLTLIRAIHTEFKGAYTGTTGSGLAIMYSVQPGSPTGRCADNRVRAH